MNSADYKKLATKCEKHISGLSIALDGVVKAEAAGQAALVKISVHRAQDCLERVIDCMETSGDKELTAPLYRMDAALAELTDGELVAAIEADLHEFRYQLDSKSRQAPVTNKELAYSGIALV